MNKTAILVDGGFYRKRAMYLWGDKSPSERALELSSYCKRHLNEKIDGVKTKNDLYRIFYYDCTPISKKVYHPLLDRTVDFSKTDTYNWTVDFLESLKKERKFALRLGRLAEEQAEYKLKKEPLKKLFKGSITLQDITENDFFIDIKQKGVDMKIGVDIASLAYKKQVSQIILISGDSDFVPAAKLARREGIDFVLDPLHSSIKSDLFEHIDGLNTRENKPPKGETIKFNLKKK
ncbi:hypothetical protein ANASTE_00686 [Anaerofustis stercorihominis DSM 17244]|uniref:NYN domain-containing protein n=1 Tax=Anaerofustis stercorihominis DSM 17244 TaxID=445971 RepID=B1C7I4_9FIRM|nr:NYN domain-containing protein [Anaerofustis stercorihominis]EDS72971.1 hypothetical protein ANASTE_00686 [Anaerofustis stercorihominis DSM 17244]